LNSPASLLIVVRVAPDDFDLRPGQAPAGGVEEGAGNRSETTLREGGDEQQSATEAMHGTISLCEGDPTLRPAQPVVKENLVLNR
jgi:hypothetical protein